MSTRLLSRLALAAVLAIPAVAQQGTAVYRLTFQSSWSQQTHPSQFPSNPHYSPLVGGLHNANASFWAPGGLATAGIERMAETGGTSLLVGEVQQQVNSGNANQVLNYGGAGALSNSPGQLSVTFTANSNFSQLTLVTMLAPSPDWFVGMHGLELIQNGDWIDNLVVPANLYDAGTDSGTSYNSSNSNTNPQDAIALVTTASGPFQTGPVQVGTFTLQRLSGSLVYGCSTPVGSMSISGNAQLGQTLQFAVADPTGQMPTPSVSGLAMSNTPNANFPCGTSLPGFGLAAGTPGEILLGSIDGIIGGPLYTGGSSILFLPLPNQASLIGQKFYFQGLLASTRVGVTEAVSILIGG